MNQLKADNGKKIIIYIFLAAGAAIMIFPFVWTVLTSLKTSTESVMVPPTFFPENVITTAYAEASERLNFGRLYYNTIVMIVVRTAGALLFSSMAGYAFARIKFPFKNLFFVMVLLQMMVPVQIFLVPQFLLMAKLNWLNTVKALIAPGIVSAFGTFLMRQFFMSLPKELEEAALIDGCNRFRIYWSVMLPLAKSGMVALGIFTAIFAWRDLLWPLIVNMSMDKMTLSTGLAALRAQLQFTTNYPVLMAGSVMAIWPMLLLFIIFQKQFIQGVASTGSKG